MRVIFDVTSCCKDKPDGIGGYGRELVKACVATAGHEVTVAVRTNRWLKRALVADLTPGRGVRLLADHFERLLLGRVDVLHCVGVRLPAGGDFARVVTVHDLNVFEFPELSSDAWRAARQRRIRETVARADIVVVPSEQGRRAMREHIGLAPERMRVVGQGVDVPGFRRPDDATLARVLDAHGLAGRTYLFNLGRFSSRKNQLGLLEAFARAGLDDEVALVLAGPRGDDAVTLRARAAALGLDEERVLLPGRVSDADLPALYAGARAYVCSSMHEGFGRPVAEAQAAGTAVASSDRGALPETVRDCGLLFDPTDADAFAAALHRIATDDALVADLERRGPAYARERFGWDRVAERMFAVYAEAIDARAA